MRSFRKILVSAVILVLFIHGVNEVSCYMYEPASDNITLSKADLKATKGKVDTLCLGTSLMDHGLNSVMMSEELDSTCFNLAVSGQPLVGSWYLLQDEAARNPIKRVFMGISGKPFVSNKSEKNTSVKLRIYSMMYSPILKAKFLREVVEPKEYEQFLFYPARVENVLDMDLIRENVEYKRSDLVEKRISHKDAKYNYEGLGYQSYDGVYKRGPVTKVDKSIFWDRNNIIEENVEYLQKIIDFCKEREIELNFVVFPHTQETAVTQGDLADMDKYISEMCEKNGIKLFNYNYTAKEDIYEILTPDCFYDLKHLSKKGADVFTKLLCEDYKKS